MKMYLPGALMLASWFAQEPAIAGPYDDCILENMRGVTSDVAAANIRNACSSKYRKVIEVTDLSVLEGYASYDAPTLYVSVNNKSDATVVGITIGLKNKKSGQVNYYNLKSLNSFGARTVTQGSATLIERVKQPAAFFNEYEWNIVRATAFDDTTDAAMTARCPDDMASTHAGDCWLRLSQPEKQLFARGFEEGWVADHNDIEWQQYQRSGRSDTKFHYLSDDQAQVAFYDQLYGDPANRSISFGDAFDLALRSKDKSQAVLPLTLMYREHRKPLSHGYLRSFVPPNKVIISQWDGSQMSATLIKRFGNETQTVTMLGLSSSESAPLDQFMKALLNVKNCASLVKLTDLYQHYPNLRAEDRENAKEMAVNSFAIQLAVVVQYPEDSDFEQFYDQNAELSGEILLDRNQTVCDRISGDVVIPLPVSLGDLMLSEAEKNKKAFSPFLTGDEGNRFISLNAYLRENGLQSAGDLSADPRSSVRLLYSWPDIPQPSSEGVATVLRVGAP